MNLQELFETVKTIEKEPDTGVWFLHQSPKKLTVLNPLSYKELAKVRDTDYPIEDRIEEESEYRELTNQHKSISFLYATIVGYNKFESPKSYPGYTYYFKLSDEQINNCVFTIIDKKEWMDPTKGKKGYKKALKIWDENSTEFKRSTKKGVGTIYPRIEVVIPFSVEPELKIPREEDRK